MTVMDRLDVAFLAAAGSAAHRFRVDLKPERVDVRSDDERAGTVLEHVFGPANLTLVGPAEAAADWTVAAVASDRYGETLQAFADEAQDLSAPGLAEYWRGDFIAEPLSRSAQRAVVRHVQPFDGLTILRRDRKLLVYVYPLGTRPFIPHFEHLVAYVLRLACWQRGYVDVHAAFVRYRGKGVALIGTRRAGKTSLAMHLLQKGGELLGSDMAELRVDAGGDLAAKAIPHMCRITPETVLDNGSLDSRIGPSDDHNSCYLAGPLLSHGKYELYEPSLNQVFGRKVCIASMKVDALLFPHFAVETTRQAILRMPDSMGTERLLNSIENDRPLADWLPFDLSCRKQAEADIRKKFSHDDVNAGSFDFHFGKEKSLSWDEIDEAFDRI
ncbi:hypothetical protein FNL56_03100 [Tardiphaga sp. vice304]|uniref:hypothetical protein n=1 Tax=Tardiphaga sp. vice304 TaxID=2592817 RepID=UPI001161D939|nr:hypothetical protein [Tardiphaga sp. vice304]QDM25249.1 hypothetical protein FNL56_03100 [Tardiphaga sp. vice304]